MQKVIFYLLYPFVWSLSRLPMKGLYLFSNLLFVILYYLLPYRKKIVLNNLELAFPEKSDLERKQIRKKFYRHLTDLIVESIKAFSISESFILKRYHYKNPELLHELYQKGKSIAFVGAHQGNWEWSISLPLVTRFKCYGAYTRIGNKYFDKAIKSSRTKFGFIGYETTKTVAAINKNFENGIQGLYLLLSDQSPQIHKTHYWANFMGVKVPIHTGAEMLAKKFDMAVVNYSIKKVKRGYFEITFETITENPKNFKDYEVTDKYLEITERNIREQPEFYLWSHRRFKHRNSVPKEWQ